MHICPATVQLLLTFLPLEISLQCRTFIPLQCLCSRCLIVGQICSMLLFAEGKYQHQASLYQDRTTMFSSTTCAAMPQLACILSLL